MGNEQSHQAQPASDNQAINQEVFDPDNIPSTSASESESERTRNSTSRPSLNGSGFPLTTPPKSSTSAQRASTGMRDREKHRARRKKPSFDTTKFAPESDEDDLASIPYREDEQTERHALLEEPEMETANETAIAHASDDSSKSTNRTDQDAAVGTTNATRQSSISNTPTLIVQAANGVVGHRYPCPKADEFSCSKTFAMLSSARRHAENTHSKQDTRCLVCSVEFAQLSLLAQHMNTHSQQEQLHIPNGQASSLTHPPAESMAREPTKTGLDPDPNNQADSVAEPQGLIASPQQVPETVQKTTDVDVDMIDEDERTLEKTTGPEAQRKRRRADHDSDDALAADEASAKRRRKLLSSPTKSILSNSKSRKQLPQTAKESKKQSGGARDTLTNLRAGNLDGFAKPWTADSQLYHPTLNPRSPRRLSHQIEINIPSLSAGSSSRSSLPARMSKVAADHVGARSSTPTNNKKVRASYTSNNGKARADFDVEYSSPVQTAARRDVDDRYNVDKDEDNHEQDLEDDSDSRDNDQNGIATVVARKTSSGREARRKSRSVGDKADRKRVDNVDFDDEEAQSGMPTAMQGDFYLCQKCHRTFPSQKAFQRHEAKPDVHKLVMECIDCNRTFATRSMLREHQTESNHGSITGSTGRKGPFSAPEVRQLHKWRTRVCTEYDLTHVEFNNMMTDSSRRNKGFVWPYRFISKADLLQEYYDVIPERDRRSMHRYRERAFKNVSSNQAWTAADDKELGNLVKEIGTRWVEIGERMGRTQDSVCQRWRNKVQYRGKQNDGEWLASETDELLHAVQEVQRESETSSSTPQTEMKISWESVSKKLKGVRTAQQCSNKWRLLHTARINGVFIKPAQSDSTRSVSGTPLPMQTPSRMSQRLTGERPVSGTGESSTRRYTSERYVHASDDDSIIEAGSGPSADETSRADSSKDEDTSDSESVANESAEHDEGFTSSGNESENIQVGRTGQERAFEVGAEQIPTPRDDHAKREPMNSLPTAPESQAERDAESDESETSAGEDEQSRETSPRLPRIPFPATTPRNNLSLSQTFNQTQANTSAIRAPRTKQDQSPQGTRPSPNVSIHPRVSHPSSMQMIADEDDSSETEDQKPVSQSATQSSFLAARGSQRSEDSSSASGTSDSSTSDGESDDDDDDDDDTMVQDTRKESFLRSLFQLSQEQRNGHVPGSSGGQQPPRNRIDWQQALSGGNMHNNSDHEDEDSSSDDEDDSHDSDDNSSDSDSESDSDDDESS